MRADDAQRGVLIFGKSQLILDETVAGLRELGFRAAGTSDFFSDVASRFDISGTGLVVLGGQVPSYRKAGIRAEIAAINPQVIFVESLAGIPGVIIAQVQGAFSTGRQDPGRAPVYTTDPRSIRLTLADAAEVKVAVWWRTGYVGPDPRSDSLLLLDARLAAGDHVVPIPDQVPRKLSFATVQAGAAKAAGAAFYAFSIATEQ
jgi:hypothetical protein